MKSHQITAESAAASLHTEDSKGAEKRRSKRIVIALPIKVMGVDALHEPFTENTRTVMVSCHGCKYEARHYAPRGSMVTLEVPRQNRMQPPRIVHATVVWLQRPRQSRDPLQIGVQFETPGNIWNVANPPDDWFPLPGESEPIMEIASASASVTEITSTKSLGLTTSWDATEIPASADLKPLASEPIARPNLTNDHITLNIIEQAVRASFDRMTGPLVQKIAQQIAEMSEASRRLHQETLQSLDARIQEAVQNALDGNNQYDRRRRPRRGR